MARWTLDIGGYAERAGARIRNVRRAFLYALYSSIVGRTPVDTGRARGNWQVSAGSPRTRVLRRTLRGPMPENAMPEPSGDEPMYIANNLPYISVLEFGGYPDPVKRGTRTGRGRYERRSERGFSRQAPQGMVGVTLAGADRLLEAAVRSAGR